MPDPLSRNSAAMPATSTPASTSGSAATVNGTPAAAAPYHRHIWIVTGPAGCGKTTVAGYLSEQLQLPYLEGDSFHPQANIDKMAAGIPLTDADRWDWLILLRDQSVSALASGASGVVLTCSALKRKYRDVIRIASYNDERVLVHFIYLHASQDVLLSRVHNRVGHYMKDSMVKSQFEALEPPSEAEKDVLAVDVSGDMGSVQHAALNAVVTTMAADAAAAAAVAAPTTTAPVKN
ncbi:hypothetical protein AAFC00_005553 [Neodothiora populina]|uniref:Gluconokinase n=1 Tax=Neodothiora populina TaxID=2781224 RepID=A0ABR3PMA8_9PEZI